MKHFLIISLVLASCAYAAPHAKYRDTYYPSEQSVIRANPLPFLWPAGDESVEYQFKLGRTADFSGPDVYRETMPWAFAYPGEELEPGTWFWQVNEDPIQKFIIPETVDYSLEIPSFNTLVQRMPQSHPRLLLMEGERDAFAKRISPALQNEILSNADLFMNTSLIEIKPPEVDFSQLSVPKVERLAIIATKGFLDRVKTPIMYLAKAWLLTGDIQYGRKCVELTLGIQNLDERLIGLNDFTRSFVQDTLVYAYDSCYGLFTEEEREGIEKRIVVGAALNYSHFLRRLECQIFDNHTWQKTYASLLRSAIVLFGHEDKAEEWLHYTYKLWFARAPATGFNYDGGWHNGTGYLTANFVTLIQGPLFWQRLLGVNAFEHPWYQNAADSILYTYPAASYSAGFGDGHSSQTHPHWKRGVFMQMMAKETQNPRAAWYAQQLEQWKYGKKKRVYNPTDKHQLDNEALEWYMTLSDKPVPVAVAPVGIAPARILPDSGYASIHTKPESVEEDIHVAFRSNPFGSGSHCLASQNAFNIIAGGKPLYLSSGYYTSFSDQHTLLHYRHSRGHNTILANGIGQAIDSKGFGQLRRHITTDDITYVMGDASDAYGGDLTDRMWVRKFKEAKVDHSTANGFGDAGVRTYYRHLLFIHSLKILVIYDELEAEHDVEWSWLLHSPNEMTTSPVNHFKTTNGLFSGDVWIMGGAKTDPEISTEFFSPAINWQKAKAYDGSVRELPKQWHLSVVSEPTKKMRFLTVIQLAPDGSCPLAVEWDNGVAIVGEVGIRAELDAEHSSSLDISLSGKPVFTLNDPAIQAVKLFSSN